MIGQTVSHYRIVGQLGAGGMGIVYAAQDDRLGRAVALKLVADDLAKDPDAIERLRSEARTASALNHPTICTIFDIGEHEGRPFIAMELIDGRTLLERLTAGRLKVLEALDLGIQVADALDVAHQRDIIHRDIKPANLFLTPRGHVKIVDFGLAKLVSSQQAGMTTVGTTRNLTAAGTTVGTVAYMSPEQVTGEDLDGRTDIFSLGVVLYECLTGRQPFTGRTSAMVFSAILTQSPVAPVVFNSDIPIRLQDIINNCLEKDRDLRYHDAAALLADLRRVKRDLESGRSGVFRMPAAPAQATGVAPDSAHHESPRPRSRTPRLAVEAATVVAVLALAVTMYVRRAPNGVETPGDVAQPASSSVESRAAAPASSKVEGPAASRAEAPAPSKVEASAASDVSAAARKLDALSGRTDRLSPASPRARGGAIAQPDPAPRDAQQPRRAPPPPPTTTPPREAASEPPSSQVTAAPPVALPPPPVAPLEPAAAPVVPRQAEPRPDHPERTEAPTPTRSAESDDAAIRSVIGTYARAIETKDIGLFRSVKPNLSGDEQRRVEEGFRAVDSQKVDVTILSVDVRGQEAAVRLRRRDTIQAGGRQQTAESQQTMTLIRAGSGWVIREIGR